MENYDFSPVFAELSEQNSLEHYGRLGMKWYQHIFGKPDGSSSASKKRAKAAKKAQKTKTAKKKAEAKAQKKQERAEDKQQKRFEDAKKSPSAVLKNRNLFSNKEVDELIAYFNQNAQLKDLSKRDFDRGVGYIQSFANAAESGVRGWNAIARTYNSVTKWQDPDSKAKLPVIQTGGNDNNNKKDDEKKKKKDNNN